MEDKKTKTIVQFKVGVFGAVNVGKTTLIEKLKPKEEQNDQIIQTLGFGFENVKFQYHSYDYHIHFYDCQGWTENSDPIFFKDVAKDAVFILYCFDLTDFKSLKALSRPMKKVKEVNEKAKKILVGTKFDLHEKLSEKEKLKILKNIEVARQYLGKCPVMFTSATTGENTDFFMERLLSCFKKNYVNDDLAPKNPKCIFKLQDEE